MHARIQKAMKHEDGFTLIELLVVMIIIGILAAIAIPVFMSQQARAKDTALKSDLSTIGKHIATHYVDNTSNPSIALNANNTSIDITSGTDTINSKLSAETVAAKVKGTFTSSTSWCVSMQENSTGTFFQYTADAGLKKATALCP